MRNAGFRFQQSINPAFHQSIAVLSGEPHEKYDAYS